MRCKIIKCGMLFGLVLAINGCMSSKNNNNYFPESIVGSYQIMEIKSKNFEQKFEDSTYQVTFDTSTFSAFIGCNRIGGGYQAHEWSIIFDAAYSTKMYCKDKAAQEIALLNCLEGIKGQTKEKGFILLENDSALLRLKRIE